MKKILFLCGMFLSIQYSYAQTIRIFNAETLEALPFATIVSDNPAAQIITDDKGQADISAFKGAQKMSIQVIGYKTKIISYETLKTQNFQLSLETATFVLDESIVSATRWDQNAAKVPAKIISIDTKDASLQNPQTSADLLGISGKVFIQKSQQGGGSPMIRGFATNRLLYTIDGVRMNTAIFRAGNIQNVISLDAFATEKVEILFGPGSVIYGSDAIGGVMNFTTLKPSLSLNDKPFIKGAAVVRYSSANNEKTAHFDINVGLKKWAFLSSVSYSDFEHLRQGSKGPEEFIKPVYVTRQDSVDVVQTQENPLLQIPTAYSQINLMQKLRFQANEYLNLEYGFHFSETSSYGRYDRHNRFRNGLPRYAEWDYGPQKWMMNTLQAHYTKPNVAFNQVSIRFAHQLFGESRIDRTLNKNERNTQTEKVNAYSLNLDFVKKIDERHTTYYGVEYIMNKVHSTGMLTDISTNEELAGPSRYPQANWNSMGAYINHQFQMNELFTFQGGLRYNHFIMQADFDTTFYKFPFTAAKLAKGSVTGSLGAVYRPMDKLIFQANFGTAFRAPNVDDLGKVFDSEPGTVTVPNPQLKAEYAYNVDLGVAKIFGDFLKIDVTAYYTYLQNALVRRDFTLNGQDSIIFDGALSQVQAIQNAAKAYVWGIQAGVEVKLPAGFTLSSDYNFQRGKEELDNGEISPSRHAAPWFGVTRLRYKYDKLFLELNSQYSGGYFHDQLAEEEKTKTEIYALDELGRAYSPGWYTFNFKASYQFLQNFSVSAGVENLADARYRTYSSGISAPGRNFVMSLKANF